MNDAIFAKYSALPGFPFDDWLENLTSFSALRAFWAEVFAAEIGEESKQFLALRKIEQDIDSPIFDVVSKNGHRGFRVMHTQSSNAAEDSGFFLNVRYGSDCSAIADSFTLDVGTDLSAPRIAVIRSLLRLQFNGEPRSLETRNEEIDALILKYADLFPAMVKTTRAYRAEQERLEEEEAEAEADNGLS